MAKIFFPLDNRGFSYYKNISNAGLNNPDVFLYYGIQTPFLNKIYQYHNNWRFNQLFELPLKNYWFEDTIKKIPDLGDEDIFFVFLEVYMLSYSRKYINFLKKKFKRPHFVFYFYNPITSALWDKFCHVKDLYDVVATFNQNDAIKYKIEYFPYFPYKIKNCIENTHDIVSDVFFVGAAKGRLPRLLKIYEELTHQGVVCDFHIVGVPAEYQKYSSDISYNKIIPYDEVIQRVSNTKCVLEVLQEGCEYVSIRSCEAFQLKKKLITTNSKITDSHFYNSDVVQIIRDGSPINISFINSKVEDACYNDLIKNTTFDLLFDFLKNKLL